MANQKQIVIIHALKNALKLDRDAYELMLAGYYISSSKNLTMDDAADLIRKLKATAIAAGVWADRPPQEVNFEKLRQRRGYANPAQLRMLEWSWMRVTRALDEESARQAFRHFLSKHFHIDRIEWLTQDNVCKVAHTLRIMRQQKEREEAKNAEAIPC